MSFEQAEEILSDLRRTDAIQRQKFSIEALPKVRDIAKTTVFLIDGLIAEGTVNLWSGGSNDGKSYVNLALADAVSRGEPFIGRRTAKRYVVIIDGENPGSAVRDRLDKLKIVETEFLKIWGGWNEVDPAGPESTYILEFVRKFRPLLIFDSLIEFHPGNENDSSETRRYLRGFRQLANAGATIVVLHHTGKGHNSKEYRGSADIKGAVDQAYLWEFIGESENRGRGPWKLTPFKTRTVEAQPMRIEFIAGKYREMADRSRTGREVVEEIVSQTPGQTQGQIIALANLQGVAKNRATEALRESAEDGVIVAVAGTRGAILYRPRTGDE
jgi:hypothetical protein